MIKRERTEIFEKARNVPKAIADKTIRHHVYSSVGVGLIPVPIADLIGLAIIRLNMLRELAKLYDVPFLIKPGQNLLSSWPAVLATFADDAAAILAGNILPSSGTLVTSIAKFVPGIGHTLGVVTMPIISGATTYAIGKVFNVHFASGETLLTFNPEKVKAYYAEMLEEGKTVAANAINSKGFSNK